MVLWHGRYRRGGQSKHGAGAGLCGLSLVKQGRVNGLDRLDSKVSVVEVRRWSSDSSGVCFSCTHAHTHTHSVTPLRIKVFQVQV